ncbi:MAG: hypothetical protein Q8S54_12670 [Bacteroidota bacterium]|nr:hypothetical protein [Odoribacter sp.]MDP3644031.1 hypothetical protein [Bacteroidota bacterium]
MTRLHKRIYKILAAILSILIVIALATLALLYFETQTYLNKNLSDFVSKKSKGKYELTFENLKINFNQWGFEINQVSFHPSGSIIRTLNLTETTKRFYSLYSPNIRIEGIRLFQLVFKKNLEIGEILISQPELNIHGKNSEIDDKKSNISTLFQELKPLVTRNFKAIKINKIELVNASFDFYNLVGDSKKLSNAENITIGILNFYTDSLLLPNPDRLFDAQDIYLRMQNYQNKLADSIHSLSAEMVTYSLRRSQIEAQNIELKPVTKNNPDKARYSVHVSQSKMISSQINEFYRNDKIPIDSLILSGVNIKYWPGLKLIKSSTELKDEFNLYELIQKEFAGVSIQNFKLENAQLTLFKSQTDQTGQQELKNIEINLEDFLLDSVSGRDTSRIFYAKNIDFSASEYELTLGDNIHRIRAANLDLSTRRKSVLIKNIQLYPLLSGGALANQKNRIDANCDSVRLDLFNFKKAYHQRRFFFQKINLFNPEFKLTQNEILIKRAEPQNTSFIYNLISNYTKGIYSNQVSVQKGKIQLVNKTGSLQTGNIESTIKLNLNGFALDENSARKTDRLFFANQIELNFGNYQMQLVDKLHKLTIENLSISSRSKKAQLQNLHLFPVSDVNIQEVLKEYNRSELYEFTIPELTLTDVDFHEAFYNKKLSVDTLHIKSPQIYYENFALLKSAKPKAEFEDLFQLLSNYLGDIYLRKVDIPDGAIRLINHSRKGKTISLDNHFSLGLENTLVNQDQFGLKKLLFSEFIDFSVRDHMIRLSDNVHVLKAAEVGFSTRRKEVFALNARLYPETDSKDFSSIIWNIQLSVPEIRIKGINIEELYFNRKIDADHVLINSPNIKLYQKRKKEEVKEIKEITVPLPKEIESIAIREFKLNDGSLKVFSEMSAQPYLLVQSDLKMNARNILILRDQLQGKTEFKSGNYLSDLLHFEFFPKDKNQVYSIDELTFSSTDRRILAKQLVVKPKTKSSRVDQFELSIPVISMNGFDMDQAYQKDQFFFESIDLDQPSIQLFNNTKDSLKINPYQINLYPHFESFANVFASGSLNVKDANIAVFKNGQRKWQENISFNLFNVRIDNKPTNDFMHATGFAFQIPNLIRKEKLYQYSIDKVSYSSYTNRFSVHDIRITPNFNKEKHQKQVGFQSDYFEGKIDSVIIGQPDIRQWFEKETISGKYMSVNGLLMDIYRDKRLQFDDKRRPKMLQDLIKTTKYPFKLDSFKLVNSSINYSEQPQSGETEGRLRFSGIQALLKPFTNIKSATGQIPDFSFGGTATIMDSCQLTTSMNYQMNNPENRFTVAGSLSPFNMRILNPVLEPLASVSIRSGKVERFQFTFSADRTNASGYVIFGYNDMKISVLEMKNGNTKEAKFASFLANSILLRSKNPRGNELLPDEINFMRDEKRSVANYWWKALFSGIRNTLGLKESKQDQPNND